MWLMCPVHNALLTERPLKVKVCYVTQTGGRAAGDSLFFCLYEHLRRWNHKHTLSGQILWLRITLMWTAVLPSHSTETGLCSQVCWRIWAHIKDEAQPHLWVYDDEFLQQSCCRCEHETLFRLFSAVSVVELTEKNDANLS